MLTDQPTVLFLDELQALADERFWNAEAGKVVEATLASAARSSEAGHIVLCLAGSDKSLVEAFFDQDRPLSFVGTRYALGPIPDDDWRSALRERFDEVGCRATPKAIDAILEASGSHARRTMHVALLSTRWAKSNEGVIDTMVVSNAAGQARSSKSW